MTVPNTNTELQVTLTGLNQVINTTFTFRVSSEIEVTRTVGIVDTPLVENSDYTVTLPLEIGQFGSIIMTPGAIGDIITIQLCPPCTQDTDYLENDRFPANVTEVTFDQVYQLACCLHNEIFGDNARVLRYPNTEFGTNNIVPIKADRLAGGAGTVFGWNGTSAAPDVLSKGSLDLVLTLSNDSSLGGAGPDAVNGVTQRAVKVYIDAGDLVLQTLIDALDVRVTKNEGDILLLVNDVTNIFDILQGGGQTLNQLIFLNVSALSWQVIDSVPPARVDVIDLAALGVPTTAKTAVLHMRVGHTVRSYAASANMNISGVVGSGLDPTAVAFALSFVSDFETHTIHVDVSTSKIITVNYTRSYTATNETFKVASVASANINLIGYFNE